MPLLQQHQNPSPQTTLIATPSQHQLQHHPNLTHPNLPNVNVPTTINTNLPVLVPAPAPTPHPTPTMGLTVQDYPNLNPVYNGVNPNYPNLTVLNQNPPIFTVKKFLTHTECDFLINVAQDCFTPAPVVGKGIGEVSSSRTSSTCYLAREDLPTYIQKICALTGKPMEHCELPQVGRYYPNQQYLQHYDAFDLSNEDGRRFASNGGQRTITVLVYLNDVNRGGHTYFPNLDIDVTPEKGMALVFFPSTIDGLLDKNVLHAAKPAIDTKYVSQVWIRQGRYEGIPSKRMFSSVDQAMLVQQSLIAAREGKDSTGSNGVGVGDNNDDHAVATGNSNGTGNGVVNSVNHNDGATRTTVDGLQLQENGGQTQSHTNATIHSATMSAATATTTT